MVKDLRKQKTLFKFEQFDNNYFIDTDRHYKVLKGRDNIAQYVWYIGLGKPDILQRLYKAFMWLPGVNFKFLGRQENDDFDEMGCDDVVIAFSFQEEKEILNLYLHRSEIDDLIMSEDSLIITYKGQDLPHWKFIGEEQIYNCLQAICDRGGSRELTPLELYLDITGHLIRQKDLQRKRL